MTRYTRTGKQILCHGEHFADAVDESAAVQVVNALRVVKQQVTAPITLNNCRVRQESDEMACACGLRWAVDDPEPPLCIHRAPR